MNFYLIGIKGTGMSHLASWLAENGHSVSGEDVPEDFYTSALLKNIPVFEPGSALPDGTDAVVYSTSYEKRAVRAKSEACQRGVRLYSYPEMLALLTRDRVAAGVSGSHGKSTTAAIASFLIKSSGIAASSIYGSFLKNDSSAVVCGDKGLVIEACEYQDHFLLYDLDILLITNISWDHPDWFENAAAVRASFRQRVITMKQNSVVICHDSLKRYAADWASERPDIFFITYGPRSSFSLSHSIADDSYSVSGCSVSFSPEEKNLSIIYDYLGALILTSALSLLIEGRSARDEESVRRKMDELGPLLSSFPGLAARCDAVADENGVLYIDDYAHHPEEIRVCLDNIGRKYPSRRLVVLFMPHTASRTEAFMKDFVSALSRCDALFIQPVYASARQDGAESDAAWRLYKAVDRRVFRTFYGRLASVSYVHSNEDAACQLASFLQSNDILLSLGAGDNRALLQRIAGLRADKGF